MTQWVKDLELLQLWHRSTYDTATTWIQPLAPRLGTSRCHECSQDKKKTPKKKKKTKMKTKKKKKKKKKKETWQY